MLSFAAIASLQSRRIAIGFKSDVPRGGVCVGDGGGAGERGWVFTGRDAGFISDVRLWPGDKHWLARVSSSKKL